MVSRRSLSDPRPPGRFIISFDCEGKWGMADHLTPEVEARMTTHALDQIYGELLATLDAAGIKATFAFVGMFTLSEFLAERYLSRVPDVRVAGHWWLEPFRRALQSGNLDGWLVPSALSRVLDAGRHEIATHGFSHIPLASAGAPRDIFDQELSLVRELAAAQGWTPRTIVYPRNQIRHQQCLGAHGVLGYRELVMPSVRGRLRKLKSLAWDWGWDPRAQPARVTEADDPVAIPSGYLLNLWHSRSRRLISRERTVARWRHMLADAASTGGVVHLWSHPHNFLTDPGLMAVFAAILRDAAERQREGGIINMTQEEFCRASAG